ncbi:hypothetical protein ACQ4M3_07265 [Leptolyngbya sp. AN03gr2]|uniref:hypothetical protein n=1 Tax=unclassified Leptolyngbya TaxID=2650499 RepID=UPI003D316839
MSEIGKYWTLVRIKPAGGYQAEKCEIAHHYIEQNYAEVTESNQLQQLLVRDYQAGSTEAELCLRCFISHCTLEEASSIARQFGDYYQFNQFDVLCYVLDDDGTLNRQYHPLSQKILNSYNPAIASLNTWATRLVRQHSELNQFLKQQGLYLKSDWAILNSTTTKRLGQILRDRFYWSANAIQTAMLYLQSYHAVYLSDRISEGSQGRCKEPTPEQLKRIADQLQTKLNQPISSTQVLKQLLAIAQCLRQHRLNRYETESIDEKPIQAEQLTVSKNESDPAEEFLYYYRAQFIQCLNAALEAVIRDYTSRLKDQKANQFRVALHLLYCQRITMTQIAEQLDLKRQDNVARLLKLKTLRADVGLHILTQLKHDISAIAQNFTDPERLSRFAESIDEALRDQVDALLEKDAQQSKTPKAYQKDNLFAEQLCALLSRNLH